MADLEGDLDAQLAVTGFNVTQQIIEAVKQIMPMTLHRLAQHFWIGDGEIGWRERIDQLAGKKIYFLLLIFR